MLQQYLLAAFLVVLGVFVPSTAHSASYEIETASASVRPVDELIINVFVDTEHVSVNAFQGELSYPTNLLSIKEIRDGNSIVNLWLEPPKQTDDGGIIFSGITPGGYRGERGLLFSAVFTATEEGSGVFSIKNAEAFAGEGESLAASGSGTPILVSSSAPNSPSILSDTTPPEPFTILLATSTDLFNAQPFIVFLAVDKGSGISHYEVDEGSGWKRGESPYLLMGTTLPPYVRVKAIDKEGNERISSIVLRPWYERLSVWLFLILVGVSLFTFFMYWRRKTQGIGYS